MNRSELREQLFLLLFRNDFHTPQQMEEQLSIYSDQRTDLASDDFAGIREKDARSITEKCKKILEVLPQIDEKLSGNTENWSLSRMGKVELTALRIALYEILYDDAVPVGVSINEAVELCKKYCLNGSASGFVNGVLAKFVTSEGDVIDTPSDGGDNGEPADTSDRPRKPPTEYKDTKGRKKKVFIVHS